MSETNSSSVTFRFEALEVALQASAETVGLTGGLGVSLRPIGQQIVRSSSSMVLNLAEGAGRVGRDRAHLFRVAYGSAKETSAAVALLQRMGAVNSERAQKASDLLDRVQAMTWRLFSR